MKERKTAIIFTEEERAITATAIKEELLRIDSSAIVVIIGMMEIRNHVLADFISSVIKVNVNPTKIVSKTKQRVEYKNINKIPSCKLKYKNNTTFRNMENILLRYNPALVITVGIGATEEVCATKEKIKSNFKVISVIDDYALNKNLIYSFVDAFLVENIAVKTEMVNNYIKEDIIYLADIPVMSSLKEEIKKEQASLKTGVDITKPTVLLVVAPNDTDAYKHQIKTIDRFREKYNIRIFVYDNPEAVSLANGHNLKASTDLDELNLLYSVADIVISCPFSAVLEPAFMKGKLVGLGAPQTALEKKIFCYLSDRVAPCENANRLHYFLDKYPREDYENFRKGGIKTDLRDPKDFFSLFF